MEPEEKDSEYSIVNLYRQEFELLKGMFEGNFSSEVIAGVLEDCDGDVNLALDTLTKINTTETAETETAGTETVVTECNTENSDPADTTQSTNLISYAAASQAKSTITMNGPPPHRKIPPRSRNVMPKIDYWTKEMQEIVTNFTNGHRVLVLMRGAPGSGKSYLAKVIVENTVGGFNTKNYDKHIFSSDDFMVINGKYHYDRSRLDEVHSKNQRRVYKAVVEGLSPVIVDNTHIKCWEMLPYARDGVNNGYIVTVVEASNPWSRSSSQLAKRNVHGVPRDKIEMMLCNFEGNCDGASLIKNFKLCYPVGMTPPVKRSKPPFEESSYPIIQGNEHIIPKMILQTRNIQTNQSLKDSNSPVTVKVHNWFNDNENINNCSSDKCSSPVEGLVPNDQQDQLLTAEKKLDQFLKVETDWENGESWDVQQTKLMKSLTPMHTNPKPQRCRINEVSNQFINPSTLSDDWINNLPAHASSNERNLSPMVTSQSLTQPKIELNGYDSQTVNIVSKNIPSEGQNSDNEILNSSTVNSKCVNEDKHFKQFRKMFKNVSRPVLRTIFDDCNGDMDWSCTLVFDGMSHGNLGVVGDVHSDTEEEDEDEVTDCQCRCIKPRDIEIPEKFQSPASENASQNATPMLKKKPKKDKIQTDDTIKIKRQIENTVKISEHHYSQHHLNIRQKIDNRNPNGASSSNQSSSLTQQANLPESSPSIESPEASKKEASPSTPFKTLKDAVPSTSNDSQNEYAIEDAEPDEDDDAGSGDDENGTVTVNMGMDFINTLDKLYNRDGFIYTDDVRPMLSIPTKLMTELNALWIESISYQMDKAHAQSEKMIQQDEEFARKLEMELQLEAEEFENYEEDNARGYEEAKPSRELTFKEIMDTDIALAIYEKDVKEEWKNKEPQDMAAQMTRKKLFELFPDVKQETLSEMLIAHNYRFDDTVEVLLISTGQGHVLDQTNGINKFVIQKEKENKAKLLQAEQNSALSEQDYPFLQTPGEKQTKVSLESVMEWRNKAESFKNCRDSFRQKAQWYYARRKLQEATFYSQMASFNTAKFDTATNFAAAALVQYHVNAHPDSNILDLHYLRVVEAETTLDLFIDDRVRQLRARGAASARLHLITGRGKHSPGRARVRPAVIRRLEIRGIPFRHQNPGLLVARLRQSHRLTDELRNS